MGALLSLPLIPLSGMGTVWTMRVGLYVFEKVPLPLNSEFFFADYKYMRHLFWRRDVHYSL
jgi:hypothetical protein